MPKSLYQKYREEIEQWDWPLIKANALENVEEGFGSEEPEGLDFLGTVFALFPSGKYYMPFACSNVTLREAHRDEEFGRALDDVAEKYGMWIESGEGDPCDVFAGVSPEPIEIEEED